MTVASLFVEFPLTAMICRQQHSKPCKCYQSAPEAFVGSNRSLVNKILTLRPSVFLASKKNWALFAIIPLLIACSDQIKLSDLKICKKTGNVLTDNQLLSRAAYNISLTSQSHPELNADDLKLSKSILGEILKKTILLSENKDCCKISIITKPIADSSLAYTKKIFQNPNGIYRIANFRFPIIDPQTGRKIINIEEKFLINSCGNNIDSSQL
ncbi:MAG: hypothetical protein ABI668_00915 [Sphingorhabdus sp.]